MSNQPITKVLVANRGEIALRVMRACRELGLKTVAVYSQADRDALHVRFADEDVCIGPGPAKESYLDFKRIIAAAEVSGAGAIHPGYGFLAENADFAEVVDSCGLRFVGPSPDAIRRMGDKARAKATMKAAGVPTIPGSDGVVGSFEDASRIADEVGYPVILKAVAGGGGKGMRICRDVAELERGYSLASSEAGNAFGNPDLYLEKVIVNPHHIEVQIMADQFGNVFHFGERDCSIQRRHQKLVEETPSPIMTAEVREKMGAAAIAGAHAVDYVGAGTVEFLCDDNLNFYFMEMNTRIQVEHPITEEAYEVDLVKDQLRVAMGERLDYHQADLVPKWAAIEVRVNAEDPDNDFRPAPGKITGLHVPGGLGVRVEKAIYSGYSIPPFYDSMVSKLIVRARTRSEAIARMRGALGEFVVTGIPTTLPFHQKIMDNPAFIAGTYTTNFIAEQFPPTGSPANGLTLKRPTEEAEASSTESVAEVKETNA